MPGSHFSTWLLCHVLLEGTDFRLQSTFWTWVLLWISTFKEVQFCKISSMSRYLISWVSILDATNWGHFLRYFVRQHVFPLKLKLCIKCQRKLIICKYASSGLRWITQKIDFYLVFVPCITEAWRRFDIFTQFSDTVEPYRVVHLEIGHHDKKRDQNKTIY